MAILLPGPTNLSEQDDVSFTSVTRGDIPYRGASAWNNLPSSTAGFVLTSNGAGADPSWQAAGGSSLTGAVILAPAASTRNVIQPAGAGVIPVIVKGHASQGTTSLVQFQKSDATLVADLKTATWSIGGAYPDGVDVTLTSSGGAGLTLVNNNLGTTASMQAYVGGTVYFPNAAGITVSQMISSVNSKTISASGNAWLIDATVDATNKGHASLDNGVYRCGVCIGPTSPSLTYYQPLEVHQDDSGMKLLYRINVLGDEENHRLTTTSFRQAAGITTTWATATDATRKARKVFAIWDTAAREVLRFEASGTAPMIGFLGGAAVVQQANASQAAITAVTDANAKSALQAIYNLLLAYGLAPATA